ncbi:MAG TPA: type 1 glutamine amidotransferase [Methylomirabilota bacterium]|nr:type 1 glutamine amidotransferase [Methylomirabilota bacterium]
MRVLSLIHGVNAHSGVFADPVRERGHELHQASYALDQPPSRPVSEYDAVMVFGGSMNTHEEDLHPWLRDEKQAIAQALEADLPLFGVCLGSQLLSEVAGGDVERSDVSEIGWYEVELTPEAAADPVFAGLPARFDTYQWHSYRSVLPPGGVELARNAVCLQAYRVGDRAWGIQFHAEVTRENAELWISRYDTDPNAVAAGFDPAAARAELVERIEGWNAIGRRLAGAFVAHAEGLQETPARRATA